MTNEISKVVRVLLAIQRSAERADREGRFDECMGVYRILGRLMALNGIWGGEL